MHEIENYIKESKQGMMEELEITLGRGLTEREEFIANLAFFSGAATIRRFNEIMTKVFEKKEVVK